MNTTLLLRHFHQFCSGLLTLLFQTNHTFEWIGRNQKITLLKFKYFKCFQRCQWFVLTPFCYIFHYRFGISFFFLCLQLVCVDRSLSHKDSLLYRSSLRTYKGVCRSSTSCILNKDLSMAGWVVKWGSISLNINKFDKNLRLYSGFFYAKFYVEYNL